MPVTDPSLPAEAAQLAAQRASVSRQLDLMIDLRGPVDQVKRLIADLDSISQDLAQVLRSPDAKVRRTTDADVLCTSDADGQWQDR